MKSKIREIDVKLILWLLAMALFILFMADRYCRMYYGGSLAYVLLGRNEISDEERKPLLGREPLIYGETLDSFPAQLSDPSMQEQNGFAIDLIEQLEWELGVDMAFEPVLWPEVFQKLEDGEVDVIQVSYSDERAKQYYLTAPIYRNRGVAFLKNEGRELTAVSELEGRKLAGIREDYALLVLKEKCPRVSIVECDEIEACAQLLREGKVDGIVADEQNLMYYMQGEKLFQGYYMLDENVYEADVVFAVRKSEEELGEILDKAIYQIRNKDVLEKIQKKWFLTSVLYDPLPKEQAYFWRASLGAGLAAFYLYLFWYIHIRTRTLVKLRTRELEQERKRVQAILDSIPQYVLEITQEGEVHMSNRPVEESLLGMLGDISREERAWQEMEVEGRWYRISCSRIKGGALDESLIVVAEDITLSRLQEEKNNQNEKMIAIGQLASGVSHELKNPLEIICNYCYALKNGILHTKEDIADTVEVIEEEARSANEIVESLLSFARVAPQKASRTELKPMLENILRLQETILGKKRIGLCFSCEDGLYIHCNPEGMKKILINLLTNAVEAMEEEREGNQVSVLAVREDGYARVEVRDTGKGMSQQETAKIFNPFYTTKALGTGLGLYLVYQQMQEIGGEIQAFSKEGEGTMFRMRFPLA